MPLAITLRFDPDTAPSIAAMWRTLAAAGIDDDRDGLGYAAHITLGVYPDDAPAAALAGAVETLARQWDTMPVTLCGFGVFPGPSSILWAAPVVTAALLARQAAIVAAVANRVPGQAVHPHYRPGAWVPHVTLSGALRDPAPALAALLPLWRPLSGVLDRLDLVRFRPVAVLSSEALRGGTPSG